MNASEPTEPTPERPTPELLRSMFLYESLDDDQLAWIAERSRLESRPAGVVYHEGEPATCLFILVQGTIALTSAVRGAASVELVRSGQRGAYAGATHTFIGQSSTVYPSTLVAVTDCEFVVMSADDFATMVREWFPMALHLLEGLFNGMRTTEVLVGQRERLLALGQMSAGLTHELNNPASAAVRATEALRERVSGMRHKLAGLASGKLDSNVLMGLTALQEEAVERVAKAPDLSPLETNDREDDLADWLDDHSVSGGFEIAPVLVAAGLDRDFMEHVAASVLESVPAPAPGSGQASPWTARSAGSRTRSRPSC